MSHSECAAVQAIRLRGHMALRHVGGMFGKERFRRPLGEPRSRPPGAMLTARAATYNESARIIDTYHVQRIRTSCVSRQSDLNAIKRNPQRGTSRGAPAPPGR